MDPPCVWVLKLVPTDAAEAVPVDDRVVLQGDGLVLQADGLVLQLDGVVLLVRDVVVVLQADDGNVLLSRAV